MPITILPSGTVHTAVDLPICFQGSAIVVIPQEDARYLDLPPTDVNWSYNITNGTWVNQGSSFTPTTATSTSSVYGFQPFWISAVNWTFVTPAAPNRFYDAYWGILDDAGAFYGWHLYKNCGNQSTTACGGPNTDNSRWQAYIIVANVPVGFLYVNFKEGFRLRSDGTNLIWDYLTQGDCPGIPSGGWCTGIQRQPLPTTNLFRFNIQSSMAGNEVSFITTFKGTYQGNIPLTWSVPLGGTLTGTGNTRCFTSNLTGTYQVCGSSDFDDPVCVDVVVDDLYIHAIDFDCGSDCVFVDDIVTFESNGGEQGILSAVDENGFTVGTILGPLSWQAPDEPSTVTLTYTVGTHMATCELQVVDRFKLTNVVGDTIIGLGPGDVFQITDNYTPAGGTVVWENLGCNNVVSADGTITIPKVPADPCFGAMDCYIRGRVIHVPGATCTNLDNEYFVDIRILVDPIFPTPAYGGPTPTKWKPETPDFRVIVNQFEGGCSETYIRNKVPIYKWTVNYDGLMYDVKNPCPTESCCDDVLGFVGGFDPSFQTATRLDDFWNFVMGTSGYFTLVDLRTGQIWRKVRFEGAMTRDHINWRKTQSRTLTMIWNPCCEEAPAGGTCEHVSTITDGIPPTVPQNLHMGLLDLTAPSAPTSLVAVPLSLSSNTITWTASTDDVGVDHYILERATNALFTTGVVDINVGNVLTYNDTGLSSNTAYYYRAKALDGVGNVSGWSNSDDAITLSDIAPGFIADWAIEDLALSNNASIASWTDRVGARAATATGTTMPIYKTGITPTGSAVARFDGVDDWLVWNAAASGSFQHIFIVFAFRGADWIANGSPRANAVNVHGSIDDLAFTDDSLTWSGYPTGTAHRNGTATTSIYNNGTFAIYDFSKTTIATGFDRIIMSAYAGFWYAPLDICRIIIYPTALTGSDYTNTINALTALYL
jgi:hypothetical protein